MTTLRKDQIWKDNKASGTLFVRIEDPVVGTYRCKVVAVYRGEAGELPVEVRNGMSVNVPRDRFNDKREGYTFIANDMTAFLSKQLHLASFVGREEKVVDVAPVDLAMPDTSQVTTGASQPCGNIGEIWRELEPRYSRFVEILGQDDTGERNKIITRYFTEQDGALPEAAPAAKATYAKRERFNGKRRGYEFVAKSLVDLIKGEELSKPFQALAAAASEETPVEDDVSNIGTRQLWQDHSSALLRLVEVIGFDGQLVTVASRYVQESAEFKPRRVSLDVTEEIDIKQFADGQRFTFVASV